MAQSDQVVQNATFPTVRADINDNLAALYSQSSGPSAPTTTVAFQPWIDTSSSPPVWKIRNAANTGWITVGVLDPANFESGGVTPIANGGTGQTTASGAINALVPSQSGNNDYFLQTNGTSVLWAAAAAGMSTQVFTASATYTRPSDKTSFLVLCTGGGGGSGGCDNDGNNASGGGGGGGTGIRLYSSSEVGSTATVTVGSGGGGGSSVGGNGGAGGSSSFDPIGSGLTLFGTGGGGSNYGDNAVLTAGGSAGSFVNAQFGNPGQKGEKGIVNFNSGNQGTGDANRGNGLFGGHGGYGVFCLNSVGSRISGNAGSSGIVIVFEF